MSTRLSVVIPCYNEQNSLATCVKHVLDIASESLQLEIVIVNDASTDGSLDVARRLAEEHDEIRVLHHEFNQGKGAALRTGFAAVSGDFVCVQDADLEYDPRDILRLLEPLIAGKADAVFGSRFATGGAHRVLYFWHSVGNKFLTFLSNIFTGLNLTDMETCYKVFRREVIQSIDIEENRFGFEPEVVAKLAQKRVRIYEMGISYHGRTYEEGKKIGARDGFRALYCIVRYNARTAPIFLQFLVYFLVGSVAAIFNLGVFLLAYQLGLPVGVSAPLAFLSAAALNYLLCVLLVFRHGARWSGRAEIGVYLAVVGAVAGIDWWVTQALLGAGQSPEIAKVSATGVALVFNFLGRRFLVFPEPKTAPN